jgi:hypothetical protein
LIHIVQRITGLEAKAEWTLEECGLASLDIAQFTNTLNAQLTGQAHHRINISISEVISATSLGALAARLDQYYLSSGDPG